MQYRKLLILVAVLVALSALAVWVRWPREEPLTAPPAADAEVFRAAKDSQLFGMATNDLRWKLQTVRPAARAGWRSWPEAARHVLTLSWTEMDEEGMDPGSPALRLANLVVEPPPHAPTLAELSAAYSAIGAPAVAAVVDEAEQRVEAAGAQGVDLADLDRKRRAQSVARGVIKLLRSYIRAHADEIAAAAVP